LFAWTLAGGNGFSATLSIEDPQSNGRRINPGAGFVFFPNVPGAPAYAFGGFDNYEGQEFPDVVANLRVDQGWGSAQIMGVVRHVHDHEGFETLPLLIPGFTATNFEGENEGEDIGWAVGAGLSLNLPFGGITFNSQGGYAEGAIAYITSDPIARTFHVGVNSGDFMGPDAEDSLTEAWMVRAGLDGMLTATWGWSLDGSYTEVDTESFAVPVIGLADPLVFEGLDYRHFGVVGNIHWRPISGLEFGWEGGWSHLELENNTSEINALIGNNAPQFLIGNDDDEYDVFGGMFRVNRDF
jgi:hypothetical protein